MVKKEKAIQYYEAVGRRKLAVATVRLYICAKNKKINLSKTEIGAGEIFVNGKQITKVFPSEAQKKQYMFPLNLTDSIERFAVSVIVRGGGVNGQIEAIVHGVSRALNLVDEGVYRATLKKHGLLRRDPRARERRKVGMGGKARRAKQSPKR